MLEVDGSRAVVQVRQPTGVGCSRSLLSAHCLGIAIYESALLLPCLEGPPASTPGWQVEWRNNGPVCLQVFEGTSGIDNTGTTLEFTGDVSNAKAEALLETAASVPALLLRQC